MGAFIFWWEVGAMPMERMLDFNSKEQLYLQLHDILYQDIVNLVYREGELIPSESELIKKFGVSRITVRRAMEMLSNTGLIEKRRGIGSVVVSNVPNTSPQQLTSFVRKNPLVEASDRKEMVGIKVILAPGAVAERLELPMGAEVNRLTRLHYDGDVPASIETNYFERAVFPDAVARDFSQESLRSYMENECHVIWRRAIQEITASAATERQAHLLKVPVGSPLLHIIRVSYDASETPRELVSRYFRPDHCCFELHLDR